MSLTPGASTSGQAFDSHHSQTDVNFTVDFNVTTAYAGGGGAVLKVSFVKPWITLYPNCIFQPVYSASTGGPSVNFVAYYTDLNSVFLMPPAAGVPTGSYTVSATCTQ